MWRSFGFVLIVLPLAIILIALAVANRAPVDLVLDPFAGRFVIEVPLFLLIFGSLAFGLLIGGFATWLSQGKWRKTARNRRREAYDLRRQADRLERELESREANPHQARLTAE
ncbi:LapA family protein [Methyloligella solikamskensis]|uniref:LapA family protein n=1 Tax=Methyloligella solikamskensis TaxID=1177756 RepID=A0ABW3J620_9HYPH